MPPSTSRPYFQYAGIEGLEPTTRWLTAIRSTTELYSLGVRGGARTLDLLIHIQALLPTELQSPCLRSLAELNHVLWIFSPSHTPRLPKLQCVGKTGFEPAASSSQGWPSSTELLPDGRGKIPNLLYSLGDSNLHLRFRRPVSYPLDDKSISQLHCKGKMPISHYEISASLAENRYVKQIDKIELREVLVRETCGHPRPH